MTRRMLELFSGTGSVGNAFRELGWEVTTVDLNPDANPTFCQDVCAWDPPFPPGHFDFIWASPVCTEYSRALTRRPRRLEVGDRRVLRTLELIRQLQPRFWAIENPATGMLKQRPFMAGLPWDDVTYCMYGYPYRKRTRIWNNLNWTPSRPVCTRKFCCPQSASGTHPAYAQQGSGKKVDGVRIWNQQSLSQLYSIPPALCREIAAVVNVLSRQLQE